MKREEVARAKPDDLEEDGDTDMTEFKPYRRKHFTEIRPWQPGEDTSGISVCPHDKANGSPQHGDMIARNPKKPDDQWLLAAQYFEENYEPA